MMPSGNSDDLRAALESRMGELASLLTEVAEALTSYPGDLRIVEDVATANDVPVDAIIVNAREWPGIQEIEQLLANWRALRALPESPSAKSAAG